MIGKNRFNEPTVTYGQMNLLIRIRTLWREMATWTWAYLLNKAAETEIAEDVFNRLYKIPQEFGNTIRLVMGNQIAERYVQLLSLQIVLIREIIEAQMAGNIDLVNEKVRQLYQNAEDRTKFIASINPYWDETVVRNLIYTYHQYTLEEISTLLSGDYQKNIDIYDRLLHHTDSIGDYFAQGLFNYLAYSPTNNLLTTR